MWLKGEKSGKENATLRASFNKTYRHGGGGGKKARPTSRKGNRDMLFVSVCMLRGETCTPLFPKETSNTHTHTRRHKGATTKTCTGSQQYIESEGERTQKVKVKKKKKRGNENNVNYGTLFFHSS